LPALIESCPPGGHRLGRLDIVVTEPESSDRRPVQKHILVVDDEPDAHSLFKQRFRREMREGTLVLFFANSGPEALAILDGQHAEVVIVLTDVNMPGMSGWEVLAEVRRRWPEISVVMITAYDLREYHDTAFELGAAGYLTKPIDFARLRELLVVGFPQGDPPD
jgi:CheY-like chemotaxis protein